MKIIYLISIIYVTTIIGQSNVEFSIVTNHVDQTINNNEPCLALNPTDESNLVVATNYRDINQYTPTSYDSAKIGIYYTVNGGDSWSDLRLPQMGRSICADPGIFFNNNGDLYCSYLGSYSENVIGAIDDSISGIYLNISTNKGQGWLVNSLIVEEKKLPFGVDKPLISVDNGTQSPFNGRVYVAYVETEGTLVKKIKLSFYDPGAQEISTPIVVNDTSIVKYVMAPFITVDKYGFVYIYFLANTTGNHQQDYKLKMLKLNPGGESVVQNSEKVISDIQPWTGDNYFAPFRTPSFPFAVYNKSTNESVVVINDYYTGTEGYLETVYFRSTNGGESWGVANRISTPIGHQFFSTISTNSQGLYSISYIKRDVDLEQYISAIHLSSDNLLSFNDEIELLDYNFYDTNLAWLNFAGDYLWSQMSDNYVYNVWINADNSTSSPQRILLSKTPILLDITPQNDLDGESKGKMLVNNEAVNSGFVKKLEPYLDHAFEVYDEILISQQQEVYKYRNWEDETLSSTFTKSFDYNTNNLSVTLFYKSTRPLTVHNYLEGGSGGGYNVTWTTPNPEREQGTFQSLENFNAFDSSDNDDKYQITIDQTIPGQYGTNWEFQYWDDGSNSLTRSNIAVSEPTTLKAYYKALMHSSYQNTIANQNQKQVLKLDNNSIILAYQSNNKVWLEVQPSAGASWFDYFDAAESKSPSLAADFTPGNENNFYLAYQEVIDASTSKIKIRYFDGGGNNLHSYEVKTVTHSSNADLQPVIIKNNGDKVLVVWREDGYGNAGLNYKYIKHTPNTSWTVKQTGIINNTNNVSLDPCLAIERTSNNPNWNPIHLVWQQGLASINYIRINQKGELFNQSEYANISSGSGYSLNYNPSLTLELNQGNYYPQVSWIGTSLTFGGSQKVVKRGKNQNGIWGFLYNVGDNVVFQTSNYAGSDHITAWSEGTSNYTIKFIKNRLYSTTHSLGSTDKYLDLSNGTSLSNMYAYTLGISFQPYRFTKSSSIGSLISKETAVEISYGRQGVAYVDTAEFYFALGDIKCNGQQIDFVDIVDSNYTADLENVNYYMKSKPFAVDNNSSLIYSVYYGLTDSLYSTEILEEGSYVNFRVQLVDVGNNEVIGEYDNITYDLENLDKYANTAYTIDMSGIGERTVQIRLVVDDNLEGGYGVSNIFGDGMLFGKNTTPIE